MMFKKFKEEVWFVARPQRFQIFLDMKATCQKCPIIGLLYISKISKIFPRYESGLAPHHHTSQHHPDIHSGGGGAFKNNAKNIAQKMHENFSLFQNGSGTFCVVNDSFRHHIDRITSYKPIVDLVRPKINIP